MTLWTGRTPGTGATVAELLLIGTALLTFGAFVLGSLLTEHLDRSMWRRDGYCPTCDRLHDDVPVSRIGTERVERWG